MYRIMHKEIDNLRIQYIQLDMENTQYAPLSCLFNNNFDFISQCNDVKLLYDILNFIPIHDTKNAAKKAQEYVGRLDCTYWKDKCIEHCCKHIDVLEAFYSSLKRNDVLTGILFYGNAMKGLLEIAYLAEGTPYPTEKWIWKGLEKVNKKMFNDINAKMVGKLPKTCEDMRNNILYITSLICSVLKEKDLVPVYIIDDLLHP